MYVGKKFFWFKKTKPKTKTRKRRQRLLVESDWKTYYGSNKHLKADVENMVRVYLHERFFIYVRLVESVLI